MPPSLTSQLFDILDRPITIDDQRRAALHVMDWIGCAAIGATTPAGAQFTSAVSLFGDGACRVVGGSRGVAPAAAAFANGGLGNIHEMDDIHRTSILHPGPVVIPAVLAAAEARDLSPADFLGGVVRGYEALIRIGRSVGPGHYANWHNTGSCGPFGAAAGVAFAIGLDRHGFMSALGNAGSTASGLWRCRHERVMTKHWHTARAAEDGLTAAIMAEKGMTGPAYILEGEQGFFAATAPDAMPTRVTADTDGPWLVYDTSFKPWAACRHAHPTIDAALAARDQLNGRADAIAALTIETYGDAIRFCDRPTPSSDVEAKFSLQHAAAVTLVSGAPQLDDFGAARRDDPETAGLRSKASVALSQPIEDAYPDHYGAAITVTLTDGQTRRFAAADATGDPARPMTEAAILAKAISLMEAAGIDARGIGPIIDTTMGLPDAGDMAAFRHSMP